MIRVVHPVANVRSIKEGAGLLRRHASLTLEMARRELTERYSGQVFGAFWVIGHPLFLMGLYVFIFAFVFRVRIGGTHDLPLDYTSYILAGLIPWLSFQDAMNKSCVAITGNALLVKQVVFPLEVLPAKGVLASLVSQAISTIALILYVLATHGTLPATYLLIPVLIVFQILAMLGVAFALSSFSVFVRDTKDMVMIFGIAGMYLMPVIFLPEWVPALFKPIMYINPFSYMIWCYQDALFYGRFEHPWAWLVFLLSSPLVFALGYRLFRKLKPSFGDLL